MGKVAEAPCARMFDAKLKTLVATLLLAFAPWTSARDDGELEKLSGVYAECAGFYTIAYHAARGAGQSALAVEFSKAMDLAMKASLMLALRTRADADIASSVTKSRIELNIARMKQESNNDNANIAILIGKYSERCKLAMDAL